MIDKDLELKESGDQSLTDQLMSNTECGRRDFLFGIGKSLAVVSSVSLLGTAFGTSCNAGPGTKSSKSGAVDVYAFKCGVLKTQTQYMLKDTRIGTPMDIPVTFFMIKHGKKWVAFDTGNNGMCAKDPVKYWSKPVTDAYYPVMKEEEEFKVQIKKALGIEPKDIAAVILSHGHLDHAGAIDNFVGTKVPIYLQKKEMDIIKDELAKYKKTGKKSAYIPEDFQQMDKLNIKTVDGIFDIFGDQSLVAFPTPGHTPGHQSLMLKQGNGDVTILCADAEYTLENMDKSIPPGLAWNIPQASQALNIFKVMSWMGGNINIVPSHDPEFWKKMPLAPKVYEL
ncbi:MAG TPA: N-acyl homoserine lactonase family protein [Spirochaetota bacterium]|nr:N-acyl homoserine lactonase family protein [Spirochaetota bacterium]